MAIKIINDGDAAVLNLQQCPQEHVVVDFYTVSKIVCGIVMHAYGNFSTAEMLLCFEENEHDIITDYFGYKISLNDFYIEDIIDLEDAIEEYIYNVFCKNMPKNV